MTKHEWTQEHTDKLERLFSKGLMHADTSAKEAMAMSDKFDGLKDGTFNRNYYKRHKEFIKDVNKNAGDERPTAFLWGNNDPVAGSAFVASLRKKSLVPDYVGHDEGPPCTTISVPTPKTIKSGGRLKDDASISDIKLVWTPMYVTGSFKDYDMSHKQFVYIVMPFTDHKTQVEYGLSVDLSSVYCNIFMPGLMCDAYKLHNDTFAGTERNADAVNRNVRVMTYNDILLGLMGQNGVKSSLKWCSTIALEEPACTNSFVHRKWKNCSMTGCLVLCLDILIEDSNYLKDDEEDSIESL